MDGDLRQLRVVVTVKDIHDGVCEQRAEKIHRKRESRRRKEGEFHRLGGVFLLSLPQIAADHGLQALRDARKYGQHDERNIGDHAVRRNADVPVQS